MNYRIRFIASLRLLDQECFLLRSFLADCAQNDLSAKRKAGDSLSPALPDGRVIPVVFQCEKRAGEVGSTITIRAVRCNSVVSDSLYQNHASNSTDNGMCQGN
jgi:hypothetical protein